MRKITRAFLCAILSLCLLLSIFGCSFSGNIPGVEVQVTFIIDSTETSVSVPYSSVEDADLIIVLDDGQINGLGTHSELIESNAIYKEIYESQTKGGKME